MTVAVHPIVIEQDEDGVYIATVPSLPGCVSQGTTREEAEAAVADAIAGYLASAANPYVPLCAPSRWKMRLWRWWWRFFGRPRPEPTEQAFMVGGVIHVRPETLVKICAGTHVIGRMDPVPWRQTS